MVDELLEAQRLASRLRRVRLERGLSLRGAAAQVGVTKETLSDLERARRHPHPPTLAKIAKGYGVEISDLLGPMVEEPVPLAEAPVTGRPAPAHTGAAVEEERRAAWEDAVDEAQRLRETGWAQMWKTLSEWRGCKQRGEPYATRRQYLDEMGKILQEAYDADDALGWAYIEAAFTQGGSETSFPSYLQEESRKTSHFYGELLGLVKSARLSVLTGDDATAAKQATAEHAAAEHAQQEMRPLRIEEPPAA